MRTRTILLFLLVLFSTQLLKSQIKIHHQILGLAPRNSINDNQFYATLGGLGHTILTRVTLEPLNYEYIEQITFDINMTSYALIGKKGWSVDFQGAVYTTSDGFQTTEKLSDRKFKKFANTSTGIIALGTDHKIYYTEDAVTWEAKANSRFLNPKSDLVWGESDDNKLLISEDGGKTWVVSADLSQFKTASYIDVVNSSTFVLYSDYQIHVTSDKGATWKTTNNRITNLLEFTFIDANTGFNALGGVSLGGTTDGGATWIPFTQVFQTLPQTGSVSLWAVMKGLIYISIEGNLYYTKDKGQTWTFFHTLIGGNMLYDVHQKGNVVIVGGPNGYYAISKDGGMLFKPDKWGNEDIMAVSVVDENTYALCDRKGQVLMLYEGGTKWGKKTTSAGNYNALHFETSADNKTVLSTRIGQPAISTDAAQNFNFVNIGGGTHFQTLKPNGELIDVTQGGIINKVNPANGQKSELIRMDGVVVKRISMATDNVGYLFSFKTGTTLSTYVTKDGWASAQPAGDLENIGLGYISVSHIADGHVIITADGVNKSFETKDYGTTWVAKDLDLLNTFANRVSPVSGSHFNSAGNFWLVTETGYLFWNDGEISTPTSSHLIAKRKEQILQVYPNPVTQSFRLKTNNIEISNLEIFNIRGEKVFQQSNSMLNSFEVSDWSKGIYLVNATSTDGLTYQTKFIKN